MSVTSSPPELPPDSPGSCVSSRLQVGCSVTCYFVLTYIDIPHCVSSTFFDSLKTINKILFIIIQNEYDDLLRRAIVISTDGLTTKVTMNQTALGLGQGTTNKKS